MPFVDRTPKAFHWEVAAEGTLDIIYACFPRLLPSSGAVRSSERGEESPGWDLH